MTKTKEHTDWDLILHYDIGDILMKEGYEFIEKESTKVHRIFKNDQDKIKVKCNPANGSYLYWNLYNDQDHGNLFHFFTENQGLTQKEAVDRLKEYIPEAFNRSQPIKKVRYENSSKKELTQDDFKNYAKKHHSDFLTTKATNYDAYTLHRGISLETCRSADANIQWYMRNVSKKDDDGTVKTFKRFGFAFPLENNGHRIGLAIKDVAFKQKSFLLEGSLKEHAYWSTQNNERKFFITEDPNDALAHKQMYPGYRHFATIGRFAPGQVSAIYQEFKRKSGQRLCLGFDHDAAGLILTKDFLCEWLKLENSNQYQQYIQYLESIQLVRKGPNQPKEYHSVLRGKKEILPDDEKSYEILMGRIEKLMPKQMSLCIPMAKDWNQELKNQTKKKGKSIRP